MILLRKSEFIQYSNNNIENKHVNYLDSTRILLKNDNPLPLSLQLNLQVLS